jgi:hypothetical protein
MAVISIRVDLGSIPGSADCFAGHYREAVGQMKGILDEKAAEERSGHAYQNRTGDLEASTYAEAAGGDAVAFGARTEYAEYVNRRGLMRVDELAAEAELEIAYLYEGLSAFI